MTNNSSNRSSREKQYHINMLINEGDGILQRVFGRLPESASGIPITSYYLLTRIH